MPDYGTPEWQAAVTAWNRLGRSQQNYAIGYIAGRVPALVTAAAAEAFAKAVPLVGEANTAVRYLDNRGIRDVLDVLAARAPGMVTAAIEEAGEPDMAEVKDEAWAEMARATREALALLGRPVGNRCLPGEADHGGCGGSFAQHACAQLAALKAVADHQLGHLGGQAIAMSRDIYRSERAVLEEECPHA